MHRIFSTRLVVAGIVCLVLAGIAAGLILWRVLGQEIVPAQMQLVAVPWSYDGDAGPAHWADLSPAFATCRDGVSQSPVDLTGNTEPKPRDLAFQYVSSPLAIVNNGHTIQANYAPGSVLISDGKHYTLLQFHFHRLSEHTVDGRPADMEMHLVHRDADGNLAVVGVFLTVGQHNEALHQVWANVPAEKSGKRLVDGVTVNAADLLPADLAYFSYTGSLTTPPCSESVRWFVMKRPVEVSLEQLAMFAALFPDNARPTQPLNERTVFFSQSAN